MSPHSKRQRRRRSARRQGRSRNEAHRSDRSYGIAKRRSDTRGYPLDDRPPDEVARLYKQFGWRVVGASSTGSDHTDCALPCQDAFFSNDYDLRNPLRGHGLLANTPLVLAVADGAGSARFSAAGAHLAVSLATALAEQRFANIDWRTTTETDLRRELERLVAAIGQSLRRGLATALPQVPAEAAPEAFNATLCLVIVSLPWLLTLQVGDGFIVIESGRRRYKLLPQPLAPSAETNVTTFITMPAAKQLVRVDVHQMPDLTGVVLSTDGMDTLALKFEGRSPIGPHTELFDLLIPGVADDSWSSGRLLRLLRSERVSDGTTDDVTLLIAARPDRS